MDACACINRMSLKDSDGQDAENHGYTIKTSALRDYGIVEPHPSQLRALPSLALFEQCPIVLTGDPRLRSQALAGSYDPSVPVPVNKAIPLDSDLFIGKIYALVRDLPGAPMEAFAGTKWLGSTIIQGRFKRPTPAADLWVGQELWNKPLLPVSFQRLVYSTAAKFFSNTSRICTEGECVGFMNPLLAMAQIVNVSQPGCQPDALQAPEDMRLLGRDMIDHKGKPLAACKRQKFFDKPSNLAAATFDDIHIYTFVIGQSILDLPKYKLSLGGLLTLDLCSILNGQPLQMMCKNVRDNSTIISLLVWHERLNYQQGIRARQGSDASYSSRASTTNSSCSGCESSSIGGHSRSSSTDCSTISSSSACDADSSSSRCGSSSGSSGGDGNGVLHQDDDSCCSSIYGSACSHFSSEGGDLDTCIADADADAACHMSSRDDAVSVSRDATRYSEQRNFHAKASGRGDITIVVDAGQRKLPGSAASRLRFAPEKHEQQSRAQEHVAQVKESKA